LDLFSPSAVAGTRILTWRNGMQNGSDPMALPVRAQNRLAASANPDNYAESLVIGRWNHQRAAVLVPSVHRTETTCEARTEIPVTRQEQANSNGRH
jgi:hypothetical protein